jgi:hypothetical protein
MYVKQGTHYNKTAYLKLEMLGQTTFRLLAFSVPRVMNFERNEKF